MGSSTRSTSATTFSSRTATPSRQSDFVYTFNRSLDPKTASGTSFFLADIKGADAVLNGKAKTASGIKALDPYTLQVTLAHRAGYFPAEISRWPAWVVDQKVIEKYGKNWIVPPHNIGSGAYQLTGQVGDQQYTFTANPNYYLGAPSIGQVKVAAVADSTAAVARYQAGEFDAVVGLSAPAILQAKANPTLKSQFHSTPIERTVWLAMNNTKAPFNKHLVRQAFNAAIDKNAIIKIALAGVGTPANAWLPPGIPGNVNAHHSGSTFNTPKARALLAKAGYPGGKGFPSVELDYGINYGEYAQVYELIQAQLQKNLGIKVGLKELPINAFNNKLASPKTRPLLWGYTFGFDYPDAQGARPVPGDHRCSVQLRGLFEQALRRPRRQGERRLEPEAPCAALRTSRNRPPRGRSYRSPLFREPELAREAQREGLRLQPALHAPVAAGLNPLSPPGVACQRCRATPRSRVR